MVLDQFADEGGRSHEQAVSRPYEVRINSSRRGAFADLRDALGSARIAKREHPTAGRLRHHGGGRAGRAPSASGRAQEPSGAAAIA